jgi:hypothetical protein
MFFAVASRSCFCTWICLTLGMVVLATGSRARGDDDSSVFGQSQQSEAALIGMMYDLKQFLPNQPTSLAVDYSTVVENFLRENWDEAILNRYYRVSRPLYTTQIFIPTMDAGLAPKAFGAEKTVKPSQWIIHYKAEVSAPSAGTYRFWGAADDVLAVAVNGATELVCCRPDTHVPNDGWTQTSTQIIPGPEGDDPLRPGDWFTLGDKEIMDLDVIIGERPGGAFNAFLLIEKKGGAYQKDAQGNLILPIFQVAPYATKGMEPLPKFATGFPIWKSFQ